jgi:hypothetical protein
MFMPSFTASQHSIDNTSALFCGEESYFGKHHNDSETGSVVRDGVGAAAKLKG